MRGLDALRAAVNGTGPAADPVEELVAAAKDFGRAAREDELVAKRLVVLDQVLDRRAARRQSNRRHERSTIGKTLAELELIVSPVDRVIAIAKSVDVTSTAIQGQPRREPPGLHHISNPHRNCAHCRSMGQDGTCRRFNWPVDRDEVCATWEEPR